MVWASEITAALDAAYGVVPALDRSPATDAVPMMLPDGAGFEGEVFCMAGAAYLAARNTLRVYGCEHVYHVY